MKDKKKKKVNKEFCIPLQGVCEHSKGMGSGCKKYGPGANDPLCPKAYPKKQDHKPPHPDDPSGVGE